MKRLELISNYGEFQAGTTIALDDDSVADALIKRGGATLAKQQIVYGHIDEMPRALQQRSVEHLEIANKAGGFRAQEARAAALAPFRK